MNNKHLLILGGNSKNNILWLSEFKNEFSKDYEVCDIFYEHWKKNNEINFYTELEKIEQAVINIKEFSIISKSIGSVISIIGISEKKIKPKKVVILGYPLKLINEKKPNVNLLIKEISKEIEVLVIEQKDDPIGKYKDVKNELNNMNIIEIPGNDHCYDDINIIKPIIDKFLD